MKEVFPEIISLQPNRVWRTYPGGRELDKLEGLTQISDQNFLPEDWIASTTLAVNNGRENVKDEGLSIVKYENCDYLLRDLFSKLPKLMVGEKHYSAYGANTQFLLKFLDSAIRLHIQCHPTVSFAKKYCDSNSGKTEGYIILNSREEIKDPYIYLGFQYPPAKEEFKEAIIAQDADKILSGFEKIPVSPGDVFLVPGGLPHAIGEGIFMIEIMEPTDLAVRIEFEKGGYVLPEESRFMNRGIDFALSMFNYEKNSIDDIKNKYFIKPKLLNAYKNGSEIYSLFDNRYTGCFRVKRLSIKNEITYSEDSFFIIIVVKGKGEIILNNSIIKVSMGDRFFVPYATSLITIKSLGGMEIITALPPIN